MDMKSKYHLLLIKSLLLLFPSDYGIIIIKEKMAKKTLLKTFIIFSLILLLAGCTLLFGGRQTYEEDLYPYILAQINDTALFFYYPEAGNVRVGLNEVAGVCNDYSSHFVDNYSGPGQVYRVSVRDESYAELERRVKVFDKSDIKISRVDDYYMMIMEANASLTHPRSWSREVTFHNPTESASMRFHTNRHGIIYLTDNIQIPTPASHAGRPPPQFYNHAWVRIVWNGITVDIDPTWYDNGLDLSYVIRIIN